MVVLIAPDAVPLLDRNGVPTSPRPFWWFLPTYATVVGPNTLVAPLAIAHVRERGKVSRLFHVQ